MNPEPQMTNTLFTIYAAKSYNRKHQLCRRISPEILIQRSTQTTQDSLNSWDEVNFSSIQGVSVDESVPTSTSSVTRITEPAASLPPQAGGGGNTELFVHRQNTMPKAALQLAAAPSTPLARISNTAVAVHSFSLLAIWAQAIVVDRVRSLVVRPLLRLLRPLERVLLRLRCPLRVEWDRSLDSLVPM